ncbi:hypothetical protein [Elizabethkingia occulta]|uniref:hypothetical protein n=1 Tax=Elizabethkingia occulta TaxID=1867263 RepID=UPI00398C3391
MKKGAYFISFATVFWIDVLTRMEYFDIVINALDYCRKNMDPWNGSIVVLEIIVMTIRRYLK